MGFLPWVNRSAKCGVCGTVIALVEEVLAKDCEIDALGMDVEQLEYELGCPHCEGLVRFVKPA